MAIQRARRDKQRVTKRLATGWRPPVFGLAAVSFSVISALVIWCAFSLSPLSNPILGRQPLALERVVSKQAPLALSRHLQQQPHIPQGLVWVPEEWGDWLTWTGAKELRVSMNSHRQVLPERLRHA